MVEEPQPRVIWAPSAKTSLRKAYQYIKKDSPKNAGKVRDTLLEMIGKLPSHPTRYTLDRFKLNNPGNYRAFEKYSYRVTYRHTPEEIYILRIRHVKRNPIKY